MCHPLHSQTAGPSRPTTIALPAKFAPASYEVLDTPALSPSSDDGEGYFGLGLARPRSSGSTGSTGSSGLRTPMATLVASTPRAAAKPAAAHDSESCESSSEQRLAALEAQLEELGLDIEDVPEDVLELLLAAAQLADGGEALRLHLENLGEAL